jgi:hypothetical protein
MTLGPTPPRGSGRYLLQVALVFVVVGGVLLPGFIELFPSQLFGRTYARWRAQLDFVAGATQPVQTLIAGDSRIHAALLPEELGDGVRSIALPGATAIETWTLLQRYLERHPAPGTLVLSIAPYHLERVDTFWPWTVKWKALQAEEAWHLFRRAEALDDPVLGDTEARELLLRWARLRANFVADYVSELRGAAAGGRGEIFRRERSEVDAARGHAWYGDEDTCSDPSQEAWDKSGFRASPLLDAYLRDTLTLASEHGIRVIFAAMPINQTSWTALETEYLDDYHRYVAGLAADHPEVRFLGFLWTLPDDHFGDASHVNPRGARVVTDWLARGI